MRMRHKPYARPELAAWPHAVDTPTEKRGCWKDFFEDPAKPLRLELGCGKGRFLAMSGLLVPEYNYLGVDIKSEMLVVAKRTIERLYALEQQPLSNIAITNYNIENIDKLLAPEDAVDRIFINFCNPWYKSGHAKHRLTHPRQLAKYRSFLRAGGELYFKTDDTRLFEDSLRYFEYTGFSLEWVCRDLHKEEPEWNVRTEHEKMFSDEGIPIKACIARMQDAVLDMETISCLKNL